ncbi:hypothetical protein LA303_00160 [Candidatus Sulfidibacterium hydrothermale]|uniref:hypothetical protein n=1 Tax=Candidatus Sulfidibacterium hydrothermale TaxID=2875962 RepID=UPI001F0A2034|nr:hypothetical protein [Candidatus Sulfidibacterium hydrothermale]UBM62412.1 hypothetical protein LA303_00160 [Candidatus Sulfidibacterium hydrothermale]
MKSRFTLLTVFFFLMIPTTTIFGQAKEGVIDKQEKPYLNIWGMVHTDVIYDLKQMDPDWIGGFRPSKIPIYPTDPGWGTNGHLYFSVRQSTFKFEGVLPTQHKWGPIRLRFEFDLFGLGIQAGETTLRFRMVYGDWGPFRVGKDWSTFIDLEAFPNNYDWWGPSGMALLVTEMFRYTQKLSPKSKMEFSLEIPGSGVDPGQLRQIDPNLWYAKTKEMLPDFITRYTFRGKGGYFKSALLLRQLSYELVSVQYEKAQTKNKFGWALNLTSAIYTFHHTGALRLQTVFGHGYAGYNNDGGVEITPDANFQATVPFQFGFTAFYDQKFGEKWSASTGFSETNENNTAGQSGDAFHKSYYSVTQLIYEILKNRIFAGLNYQYGKRFNKDGASADDQRIMFSVRFIMDRWR